ncbi:hypothetical protein GPL21_17385 [Bradyrhizobium pachyrhizi]|uniref:Uncharacterized protein n=1 Tax=Bradyrhizobium pachyrhizi TaxID=280333 RepID=A0A844SN39_9BRAD|nr:hypothetical protein [Bradyrhizobium pachyrhizi]MVT66875.1 hypothetical protein [Bradyrhizobium pachyrhizi]
MKRIKRTKAFERSYLPMVLWSEDLDEIVSAFKEARNDRGEVVITTDDYQFESVDDLKEHFGSRTLTKLEIAATQPFGYVKFDMSWVKLYVSSGPKSAHLFHEIDAILSRCQRKPKILYNGWFLTAAVLINLGYSYLPNPWLSARAGALLSTGVSSIVLVWTCWAWLHRAFRSAVIRLQHRKETKPFFERNKDQLVMLLIGALIGGMVTFGGVVLKEHFYPSATVTPLKAP